MFVMEETKVNGFSENGFQSFRDILSAVDYLNNLYQKEVESSTSVRAPLLPLKLNRSSIFYKVKSLSETHEEVQVLVGDFLTEYPPSLLKRKGIKAPTIENVKQLNWNKVGDYLAGFYGNEGSINVELEVLTKLLRSKNVRYEDILWQPAVWEANVKMEFIREIFWIMDRQRGKKKKTLPLARTEKAKELIEIKRPLKVLSCVEKFTAAQLGEKSLFDSVRHLRDWIVGHHAESYNYYKGQKSEIGPEKAILERFLQNSSSNYMINLSKEIRSLNWITESPVLRDENNYMAMFYDMEKAEKSGQS